MRNLNVHFKRIDRKLSTVRKDQINPFRNSVHLAIPPYNLRLYGSKIKATRSKSDPQVRHFYLF